MLNGIEKNKVSDTWLSGCSVYIDSKLSALFPSCTREFFGKLDRVSFTVNFIDGSISLCVPATNGNDTSWTFATVLVERLPHGEYRVLLPEVTMNKMERRVKIVTEKSYDLSFSEDDNKNFVGITIHFK